MNLQSAVKNIIFWGVVVVFALLIWAVVRSNTGERIPEITFTQFLDELDRENVRQLTLTASDDSGMLNATGTLKKDNRPFSITVPQNYPDLYRTLREKKVEVILRTERGRAWLTWLIYYVPYVIFLAMWIYFTRQLKEGLRGYRPPTRAEGPEHTKS